MKFSFQDGIDDNSVNSPFPLFFRKKRGKPCMHHLQAVRGMSEEEDMHQQKATNVAFSAQSRNHRAMLI